MKKHGINVFDSQLIERDAFAALFGYTSLPFDLDPAKVTIVDIGDADIIHTDTLQSHANIERGVRQILKSGALPVVGVPLPLISYGGTAAVTLLAGMGILMSAFGNRKFIRR